MNAFDEIEKIAQEVDDYGDGGTGIPVQPFKLDFGDSSAEKSPALPVPPIPCPQFEDSDLAVISVQKNPLNAVTFALLARVLDHLGQAHERTAQLLQQTKWYQRSARRELVRELRGLTADIKRCWKDISYEEDGSTEKEQSG